MDKQRNIENNLRCGDMFRTMSVFYHEEKVLGTYLLTYLPIKFETTVDNSMYTVKCHRQYHRITRDLNIVPLIFKKTTRLTYFHSK